MFFVFPALIWFPTSLTCGGFCFWLEFWVHSHHLVFFIVILFFFRWLEEFQVLRRRLIATRLAAWCWWIFSIVFHWYFFCLSLLFWLLFFLVVIIVPYFPTWWLGCLDLIWFIISLRRGTHFYIFFVWIKKQVWCCNVVLCCCHFRNTGFL